MSALAEMTDTLPQETSNRVDTVPQFHYLFGNSHPGKRHGNVGHLYAMNFMALGLIDEPQTYMASISKRALHITWW